MTLLVRSANLSQQVERHLPVEEFWLKGTRIEQLGGLTGQFTNGCATLGGHGKTGGQADALQFQALAQRRQHHSQRGRRRTGAADLKRLDRKSTRLNSSH